MALKILLNGAKGRMGQTIARLAPEFDAEITAATDIGDNPADHIDAADMVVDFSFHTVTPGLAELAAARGKPIVIGTTGLTPEERARTVACASKIPMVYAGNYSVGINLMYSLISSAAKILGPEYNLEVMEMHHNLKKDAPSGTAEHMVEILRNARGISADKVRNGREGIIGERPVDEIGVHAIRGGDIVGEHTVYFIGPGERIEITHKASDRAILARGALRAAVWLANQKTGLYEMGDVLGLSI